MKLFQKSLSLLLLFCLVFSLVACGNQPQESTPTAPTTAAICLINTFILLCVP